jgi:hypothetical protein
MLIVARMKQTSPSISKIVVIITPPFSLVHLHWLVYKKHATIATKPMIPIIIEVVTLF